MLRQDCQLALEFYVSSVVHGAAVKVFGELTFSKRTALCTHRVTFINIMALCGVVAISGKAGVALASVRALLLDALVLTAAVVLRTLGNVCSMHYTHTHTRTHARTHTRTHTHTHTHTHTQWDTGGCTQCADSAQHRGGRA